MSMSFKQRSQFATLALSRAPEVIIHPIQMAVKSLLAAWQKKKKNHWSAPLMQLKQVHVKQSGTHGRCSESLCMTSWSSHKWSSPTAGYTHPCWHTSPPGKSCLGLEDGGGWRVRTRARHNRCAVKQQWEPLLSLNNAGPMQKKCTLQR